MDMHSLTRSLHIRNDSKIVLLVADGLGGLPLEPGGLTELETLKSWTPLLVILGCVSMAVTLVLALLFPMPLN